MNTKVLKSLLAAIFLVGSGASQAALFDSLLNNYDVYTDFSSPSLAPGSIVNDQFDSFGMNFLGLEGGNVQANGCGANFWNSYGFEGDFINSYDGCSWPSYDSSFGILFSEEINALSFTAIFSYLNIDGYFSLETYLNGSQVNSYSLFNAPFQNASITFLTVTETVFDEIRFTIDYPSSPVLIAIDSLAYSTIDVPEPAILFMFLLILFGLITFRELKKLKLNAEMCHMK